jgi:hypothetical protein
MNRIAGFQAARLWWASLVRPSPCSEGLESGSKAPVSIISSKGINIKVYVPVRVFSSFITNFSVVYLFQIQ